MVGFGISWSRREASIKARNRAKFCSTLLPCSRVVGPGRPPALDVATCAEAAAGAGEDKTANGGFFGRFRQRGCQCNHKPSDNAFSRSGRFSVRIRTPLRYRRAIRIPVMIDRVPFLIQSDHPIQSDHRTGKRGTKNGTIYEPIKLGCIAANLEARLNTGFDRLEPRGDDARWASTRRPMSMTRDAL